MTSENIDTLMIRRRGQRERVAGGRPPPGPIGPPGPSGRCGGTPPGCPGCPGCDGCPGCWPAPCDDGGPYEDGGPYPPGAAGPKPPAGAPLCGGSGRRGGVAPGPRGFRPAGSGGSAPVPPLCPYAPPRSPYALPPPPPGRPSCHVFMWERMPDPGAPDARRGPYQGPCSSFDAEPGSPRGNVTVRCPAGPGARVVPPGGTNLDQPQRCVFA